MISEQREQIRSVVAPDGRARPRANAEREHDRCRRGRDHAASAARGTLGHRSSREANANAREVQRSFGEHYA